MFLIRILLGILALPLLITAFILKLLFKILSNLGTTITFSAAAVFILSGSVFVFSALFGSGDQFNLGCLLTVIGFVILAIPRIADFLEDMASALLNWIIKTFYK